MAVSWCEREREKERERNIHPSGTRTCAYGDAPTTRERALSSLRVVQSESKREREGERAPLLFVPGASQGRGASRWLRFPEIGGWLGRHERNTREHEYARREISPVP